jgi:hypothetical protein
MRSRKEPAALFLQRKLIPTMEKGFMNAIFKKLDPFLHGQAERSRSLPPMTQALFFVPSEEWHRKMRRRLELLEGERLATREQMLDAFLRNRDSFQPEARQRIELGLRIYSDPPSGRCLTCGAQLPDQSRYYCSTLCEQSSRLVIRDVPQARPRPVTQSRVRPCRHPGTLPRRSG